MSEARSAPLIDRDAPPGAFDFDRFLGAEPAFRAIFDAAPYGLVLVDGDGMIVLTNPRLDAKFGYEHGELIGSSIELLLPERHRQGHVVERNGYVRDPSQRPMGAGRDLAARRKDGVEFPIEIGLCTIDVEGQRYTCACVVDITLRKRSEIQLRETNALLEEFTYVASHDLRSPVRGIGNLIEFVREDFGDEAPETVRRNLDRMSQRVEQLERLIDDLLAYARSGHRTSKLDLIDLRAIVAEVIALEAPGSEVTIVVDIPEMSFLGGRVPLATVIRNLLGNAIKHHDRERKEITIRARPVGKFCVIEVGDDGPGIPVVAQARIFRLFQTLAPGTKSSTGLGLAVVQRLVEGHGGTVSVRSEEGRRGTVFTVNWPLYPRSELDG